MVLIPLNSGRDTDPVINVVDWIVSVLIPLNSGRDTDWLAWVEGDGEGS